MWMNEAEIDHASRIVETHAPQFFPFAKFLSDWRDTVNNNSDGWPYWKAGASCADKLMTLISKTMDSLRGDGEMPTEAEFRKSLTPIRAAATRFKLPTPELLEAPSAGMRP